MFATLLTVICAAILAVSAAFHFYWGFGGLRGSSVSVPLHADGRKVFSPGPLAMHAAGVALVGAIVAVLGCDGLIWLPLPEGLKPVGLLAVAVVLLARALSWQKYLGFFKKVHNTRFAKYDTYVYSPLCLFMGLSLLYVYLQGN